MTSRREAGMQAVHSQLTQISRRGVARNRREAAPLTVVQHTLLTFIATNPACRAVDIAQALRLNRSTVSRQVADLMVLELVRNADEEESEGGRGQILLLTDRGAQLLTTSIRANQVELERRLSDWTDDEIDRLAGDLTRFNDADPA